MSCGRLHSGLFVFKDHSHFSKSYTPYTTLFLGRIDEFIFGKEDRSGDEGSASKFDREDTSEEDPGSKSPRSKQSSSPNIKVVPKHVDTGEVQDAAHHGGYIPMYQSEGRFRVSISWPSGCDRGWVELKTHPDVVCTFDEKGPEFKYKNSSFKLRDYVSKSGFHVNVSNPRGVQGSVIQFVLKESGKVLKTVDVRS
ncbi:hypothetical protein [Halorubrum tebenquichense]|uniref:hypothetical protein n=1 Tax=Halorubrum tebenquichense TaxID=119434 RepID=UPI0012679DF8|nr:hypothetical protein [Halorubrum tebenquichense]